MEVTRYTVPTAGWWRLWGYVECGLNAGCYYPGSVTVAITVVTPGGARPTASPSASPDPSATPTPTPTPPPNYRPPGFSTPDPDASPSEGPADVNICTDAAIAACRTLSPEGSGDIFSSYNPDPSGFIGALSDKAPFGYVVQFGDAIGGALDAPGSAMPDLCESFTLGDLGEFEFCIPLEPFTYLAEWRWLLVGLVWLAGLIGLYRIASSSVGGGDDP
jgi:hypothetical protein